MLENASFNNNKQQNKSKLLFIHLDYKCSSICCLWWFHHPGIWRVTIMGEQTNCLVLDKLVCILTHSDSNKMAARLQMISWNALPWERKILVWLHKSWWRHQMETFSALLTLCAGNSSVTGEFPTQRPVTRSFDVFFDLRMNKRLSKLSRGWWFETPASRSYTTIENSKSLLFLYDVEFHRDHTKF